MGGGEGRGQRAMAPRLYFGEGVGKKKSKTNSWGGGGVRKI